MTEFLRGRVFFRDELGPPKSDFFSETSILGKKIYSYWGLI